MLNLEQCFHLVRSPPLTSTPTMTLTYLLFFIAPTLVSLFSLALSCCWEVLQNLCSNHLPILLTVPFFPVFLPNERLPSLNIRKARQDDFAFYFDSHYPSAEEYSSLFLSFAAVLFTSVTLNALLTIWYSGQTALFLSLLAKTALTYLPTALSVASRPPFPSQQAQYAQVFPLKPAPFCKLFASLGSTNKSAISLLFYYLTLALSSPPCPLLHLSLYLNLCQKLFSLFSSSIKLQWVPGHSFLPDDDAADELARRGALLVPSAIPCSHSSLISGIHSSRTGGILSHRNSSTHRFPRFPPRNLCFYVMLAVFSLSSLQRTQPSVKLLSL